MRARMVQVYNSADRETCKQLEKSLAWKQSVESAARAPNRRCRKDMKRERDARDNGLPGAFLLETVSTVTQSSMLDHNE